MRVTVNASGTVVSYDDYYPFGALMYCRSQDSSSVDGRYKYIPFFGMPHQLYLINEKSGTGKERDDETKYDYFGARYYDARIGRFLTVDPLSDDERLIGWSPYHYGYNNPIKNIELLGMQPSSNEERTAAEERLQRLGEKTSRERTSDEQFVEATRSEEESTEQEYLLNLAKIGLDATGVGLGIGQYSQVASGMWRDPKTGKWYKTNFYGNQYTHSQAKVLARSHALKLSGRVTFVGSVGISAYQGGQAYAQGDYSSTVKSGVDMAMAGIAAFGGPKRLAVGTTYFVLDAIGVFSASDSKNYTTQPFTSPPDKTYVAPQLPDLP